MLSTQKLKRWFLLCVCVCVFKVRHSISCKMTAKSPCWSLAGTFQRSKQIPHLWQGWRNKWFVYSGWNSSCFRCFPSRGRGPQSELTSAVVSVVTQQAPLCESSVDTVGPRCHTAAFAVPAVPLPGPAEGHAALWAWLERHPGRLFALGID